jgi:hypothetical protein
MYSVCARRYVLALDAAFGLIHPGMGLLEAALPKYTMGLIL